MIKLENDEVLLEKHKAQYGSFKIPTILIITNKRLLFTRERGIFRKKERIYKSFIIEHFKVYKDSVQMKQKMLKIAIQSSDGDFEFFCENVVVAKEVYEKIASLRLGNTYLERTTKKVNYFRSFLKGIYYLLVALLAIPLLLLAIFGKGKEAIQMLMDLGKKIGGK